MEVRKNENKKDNKNTCYYDNVNHFCGFIPI